MIRHLAPALATAAALTTATALAAIPLPAQPDWPNKTDNSPHLSMTPADREPAALRELEIQAQVRAADAATRQLFPSWISALVGVASAAISVAGTALIYFTLRETRKTTAAALASIQEAEKATSHAQDSVRLAEQTLRDTRSGQRAWMVSQKPVTEEVRQDGVLMGITVRCRWTNVGLTPALKAKARYDIAFDGNMDHQFPHREYDAERAILVAPNESHAGDDRLITTQQFQIAMARMNPILVFSRIDYFDIFEPERPRFEEAYWGVRVLSDGSVRFDPKLPSIRRITIERAGQISG